MVYKIKNNNYLGIAIGNFYPQNQRLTSSLSKVHLSQRSGNRIFLKLVFLSLLQITGVFGGDD